MGMSSKYLLSIYGLSFPFFFFFFHFGEGDWPWANVRTHDLNQQKPAREINHSATGLAPNVNILNSWLKNFTDDRSI